MNINLEREIQGLELKVKDFVNGEMPDAIKNLVHGGWEMAKWEETDLELEKAEKQ